MLDLGTVFKTKRIREDSAGNFRRRVDSDRGKCLTKHDSVFTLKSKYIVIL